MARDEYVAVGTGDALPIRSASVVISDGRLQTRGSQLAPLRSAIDRVDEGTAKLLAQRALLAKRVNLAKIIAGMEARSLVREANVHRCYAEKLSAAGYANQRLAQLTSAIIEPPHPPRIIIQGGVGSWSEESLRSVIPNAEVVRAHTVPDAWRRCKAGHAVAAWLASWNSTIGEIPDTKHPRLEAECWGELDYPIRHALVGWPGATIDGLTRIEGHPLALAQCERTLAQIAPQAERVPTVDGAASAHRLRDDKTAVVASPRVAANLRLRVLAESIVDRPENATRFQLLIPSEASR